MSANRVPPPGCVPQPSPDTAEGQGSIEFVTVPGFVAHHGFATRAGGVSSGPFESLNLREVEGDEPGRVLMNQERFAKGAGSSRDRVALLRQVHGDDVVVARTGEVVEADAQLSSDPDLLLVIGTADCLPLLFSDLGSGAVAAAHCGWRGTVKGLAAKTVAEMGRHFGTEAADVQVAIGPGICRSCYQVGPEVVDAVAATGFADEVLDEDGDEHWRLDLALLNRLLLVHAGVAAQAILDSGECTSCNPQRYFSHRRDRGRTGRHWAFVRASQPS